MIASTELWFAERLRTLTCSPEVKVYIGGVFNHFVRSTEGDLSNASLVLTFIDAKDGYDFTKYQHLGDWVLWASTLVPQSVVEKDIAYDLARLSYYACYKMLRQRLKFYEELADNLPNLVRQAQVKLYPECNLGQSEIHL